MNVGAERDRQIVLKREREANLRDKGKQIRQAGYCHVEQPSP
jgi:hypothetical protein